MNINMDEEDKEVFAQKKIKLTIWRSQIGTFVPSKRSLQSVKYQFCVSYYYTYNGRSLFKYSEVFVIRSKEVTIIICDSVSKYWWVNI